MSTWNGCSTFARTRDLVRSLESLEERTRQRAGERQGNENEVTGQGQSADRAEAGERRRDSSESAGATTDAFPGYSPGEVRQFRREFRERRAEAERLRDQLAQEGMETDQLNAIVAQLRDLERERHYGDPGGLTELQAQVIQDLKEFEFVLRRELGGGDSRQLMLTGSDEVPPGYRVLVEEYYRTLAEQGSEKR